MNETKSKVVTLSGSMKFWDEFVTTAARLSSMGYMVLTPFPIVKKSEDISEEEMKFYKELHKERIDKSDKLFVINKNGYIGDDTKDEIIYALHKGIEIEYLESNKKLPVVTLCGSGRFYKIFKEVEYKLFVVNDGIVVHMPAIFNHPNFFNGGTITDLELDAYDRIHKQKMSSSDYVITIDVDGYIGTDTRKEVEYCKLRGIPVISYRDIDGIMRRD